MTKEQKNEVIEALKEKFSQYNNFYVTNTESLSVAQVTKLRRVCFSKNVEMKVAKNTLIRKALESLNNEGYSGMFDSLNKVTALMFSENPKDPALIISSFRTETKGEKPELKAAFINGDIYTGDKTLKALTQIKTKNELIGEVIGLLQSPAKRVLAALLNHHEQKASAENTPPVAEETAPVVAETKTPASDKAAPVVAETKAVAPEASTPVAETKTAAPEASTPVAETKTTAPEASAPVAETKAVAPEASAPVDETPAAEAKGEETPKE